MKFNEPGRHKLVRQLFLAVGEARKAIFWTTPGFKDSLWSAAPCSLQKEDLKSSSSEPRCGSSGLDPWTGQVARWTGQVARLGGLLDDRANTCGQWKPVSRRPRAISGTNTVVGSPDKTLGQSRWPKRLVVRAPIPTPLHHVSPTPFILQLAGKVAHYISSGSGREPATHLLTWASPRARVLRAIMAKVTRAPKSKAHKQIQTNERFKRKLFIRGQNLLTT